MTLHFAAQYDKLDFGFGTQPLLGFRGLVIQKDAFACVDYFMPVSNSDVERWRTSWMINWNGFGRKRSWRNRYTTQHATWGTEENHENLHLKLMNTMKKQHLEYPWSGRISNSGSPQYRSMSLPQHRTAGSRLQRAGLQTQQMSDTNLVTTDNRTEVFQFDPFTSHHNRYLYNTCYYAAKWHGKSLVVVRVDCHVVRSSQCACRILVPPYLECSTVYSRG